MLLILSQVRDTITAAAAAGESLIMNHLRPGTLYHTEL